MKITVEESKVLAQIRFQKEIEEFNNRLKSEKLLAWKSNKYYKVAESMSRKTSYTLNECLSMLKNIDSIILKKESGEVLDIDEIMTLKYWEMI